MSCFPKRALVATTLSLSVAACDPLGGTTRPASPNAADSAAVTPLLQSALYLAETVTQFEQTAGITVPDPSQLMWTNAAQCVARPGPEFSCPPVTSLGPFSLTYYTLYEGMHEGIAFNNAATSSISISWFANDVIGNPSSLVHQNDDNFMAVKLSGLLSAPRLFGGIANASFIDSPSQAGTSVSTTITDVGMGADHFPVTGRFSASVSIRDSTHITASGTMTVDFDGTSTGHVALKLGNTTQNCLLALQAPSTRAVCTP